MDYFKINRFEGVMNRLCQRSVAKRTKSDTALAGGRRCRYRPDVATTTSRGRPSRKR
jgi:hypothetical protein